MCGECRTARSEQLSSYAGCAWLVVVGVNQFGATALFLDSLAEGARITALSEADVPILLIFVPLYLGVVDVRDDSDVYTFRKAGRCSVTRFALFSDLDPLAAADLSYSIGLDAPKAKLLFSHTGGGCAANEANGDRMSVRRSDATSLPTTE